MSMNKFMHPRNIYKSPPNFKELALQFPEFRPFVKQKLNGKVTLDFKDLKSLRALSCTLLKKDFGLTVDIPLNKLIPTVPLRLNYILWIEDLLRASKKYENIIGIDIGTGASCIYPLLAAKRNNWSMVCTENDYESFVCAKHNIEANNLQNLIQIILVTEEELLEEAIAEKEYDFCMCNPPFFASPEELHPFFKSRKSNRPHPKNAFCAAANEVISKGGEVEFITKLIYESKHLNKKIKIYTTMIGHKCSLPPLKKLLRDISVASFKESYFCQGNTTRWGLAWTFYEEFDLRNVRDPIKQSCKPHKAKEALMYTLPLASVDKYSLYHVSERLLNTFKDLQMTVEEVSRNNQIFRYFVTASSNTWSDQRRKRREKIKVLAESCSISKPENMEVDNEKSNIDFNNPKESNNNMNINVKSPGKRTHLDSFDGNCLKKLKITSQNISGVAVFFKFLATVKMCEDKMCLGLNCCEESDNREHLHQILQYIKNNLHLQGL